MSLLVFNDVGPRARIGLKGPQAAAWLLQNGVELPEAANTWLSLRGGAGGLDASLIARLGASEFFLEEGAQGGAVRALEVALASSPPGVYPVLREDAAFSLSGDASHEVLAQVCSIDFARVAAASRSVFMTMMIGVAVLVVLNEVDGERYYRIWCDPTFGAYLGTTVGMVVMENGGKFTGVSA